MSDTSKRFVEKRQNRKSTVLHLAIELFFAVLPLVVLGLVWPAHGDAHPISFLAGPEWSMTACILYGLALARLQFAIPRPQLVDSEIRPAVFATLTLIPLTGAIVSVILITKFANGNESWWMITLQLANLVTAIATFFVIGGYGISRFDRH